MKTSHTHHSAAHHVAHAAPAIDHNAVGSAAFEATRAEREGLAPEKLLTVNLDVGVAAQTALGAYPRIITFEAQIRALPGAGDALDNLREHANAAAYANSIWLHATTGRDNIQRLAAIALPMRTRAFSVLTMGIDFGWFEQATVDSLRAGTGYQDLVSDMNAAEQLIRGKWSEMEGKVPLTLADLDAMAVVATELHEALGLKDTGNDPFSTVPVSDRQRSFTLLAHDYDQLQRALTWIRWAEGDVDQIAPSMWLRTGTTKHAAADTATATKPATPVAPVAPATGTPAAPAAPVVPAVTHSTTTPAPAAAGPNGLPFAS